MIRLTPEKEKEIRAWAALDLGSQHPVSHLLAELDKLREDNQKMLAGIHLQSRNMAEIQKELDEIKAENSQLTHEFKMAQASMPEVSRLRERVEKLEAALKDWMESYSLMTEKTDGILRESIRGFFLNCPWNTKQALAQDELEKQG